MSFSCVCSHLLSFLDIHGVNQTAFNSNPVVEQYNTSSTCSMDDGYPARVTAWGWKVGDMDVDVGKLSGQSGGLGLERLVTWMWTRVSYPAGVVALGMKVGDLDVEAGKLSGRRGGLGLEGWWRGCGCG